VTALCSVVKTHVCGRSYVAPDVSAALITRASTHKDKSWNRNWGNRRFEIWHLKLSGWDLKFVIEEVALLLTELLPG